MKLFTAGKLSGKKTESNIFCIYKLEAPFFTTNGVFNTFEETELPVYSAHFNPGMVTHPGSSHRRSTGKWNSSKKLNLTDNQNFFIKFLKQELRKLCTLETQNMVRKTKVTKPSYVKKL